MNALRLSEWVLRCLLLSVCWKLLTVYCVFIQLCIYSVVLLFSYVFIQLCLYLFINSFIFTYFLIDWCCCYFLRGCYLPSYIYACFVSAWMSITVSFVVCLLKVLDSCVFIQLCNYSVMYLFSCVFIHLCLSLCGLFAVSSWQCVFIQLCIYSAVYLFTY